MYQNNTLELIHMACNTIITIGRQYGSGGHEIGEKLAAKLGIPFYDKQLLKVAAKESGIMEEVMKTMDEKPDKSFLYSLVTDPYTALNMGSFEHSLNYKVVAASFDAIKKIAAEGPCVIIGRCADYALQDYENCVNVFITAPIKVRCDRIMKRREIMYNEAMTAIKKTDKQRESYHNFYATTKWGNVNSYDLCINSHALGIDGTVDLLCDFVTEREKNAQA